MRLTIDGGSWGLKPGKLRSAHPYRGYVDYRFSRVGFRLVAEVGSNCYQVIRGGPWDYGTIICRSSSLARDDFLGFRLVEEL